MADLRLVLVTPEKTLFDREVESVSVPMFDGSTGIYPHRAPLVGRLGFGELTLRFGGGSERYFIEGGFVQVKGLQVSVLTSAAVPVGDLTVEAGKAAMEEAKAEKGSTDAAIESREQKLDRARKMITIARRN